MTQHRPLSARYCKSGAMVRNAVLNAFFGSRSASEAGGVPRVRTLWHVPRIRTLGNVPRIRTLWDVPKIRTLWDIPRIRTLWDAPKVRTF